DLLSLGVTALGPRKKIVHALSELRKGSTKSAELQIGPSEVISDETDKLLANKLITDYFPGFVTDRKKGCNTSGGRNEVKKHCSDSSCKHVTDAFKYLRRDCSYWFLTHFHIDHYQGLTRSFCHGKIYCSLITARLVNLKIGIPWDRLQVLPLSQKISIAGVDVTCFDANHCPGSILILFEPPSGKAVLHTGDFRLSEEMMRISILQTCPVHTLILDSTYCDPQYDFPKQDAVIQFVIEAIQAEAFNPKTLFLIGSYTIGKERLFVEVARVLRKKVYVTAAKLRLLECLGLSSKDMQWFTLNEQESQIHVVPMWTLASFKRLKHVSNQYAVLGRSGGEVSGAGACMAASALGQGSIQSYSCFLSNWLDVWYEVPYSEHCSFTELKEFVKFISPVNIIPSVNNNGPESSSMMVSHLLS
ncbi:hypothetical protein RJ639_036141, partial [Escallonia herrerae]